MRRRDFIAGIGGAAAWPLTARAQQPALPVVGVVSPGSPPSPPPYNLSNSRFANAAGPAAFFKGLSETGYHEGQNVTVEWHLGEAYERLPSLMADLETPIGWPQLIVCNRLVLPDFGVCQQRREFR